MLCVCRGLCTKKRRNDSGADNLQRTEGSGNVCSGFVANVLDTGYVDRICPVTLWSADLTADPTVLVQCFIMMFVQHVARKHLGFFSLGTFSAL